MAFFRTAKRSSAGLLSVFYFLSHVVYAHSYETNLWKERGRALPKNSQFAALTAQFPGLNPKEIPAPKIQIPPIGSHFETANFNWPRMMSEPHVGRPELRIPQTALLNPFGTIRRISGPPLCKARAVVLHIQDVHRNAEAQRNIGKAIQALLKEKQTNLIALEGAFGPIDLEPFLTFPRRETARRAADYLLGENLISGAIHGILNSQFSILSGSVETPDLDIILRLRLRMTNSKDLNRAILSSQNKGESIKLRTENLPVRQAVLGRRSSFGPLIGIDDRRHYEAHVDAYRQAAPHVKKWKERLEKWGQALYERRTKSFNPSLLAFHAKVEAFRNGTIPLGKYAGELQMQILERRRQNKLKPFSNLRSAFKVPHFPAFLEALELESTLNFSHVEAERSMLLSQLASRLDKVQTAELMNAGLAFRAEKINTGRFYDYLRSLCERNGVKLDEFKAMGSYVKYILLTENIDADALLNEVKVLEDEAYASLTKTEEEKEVLCQSRWVYLADKLVDFALTKEEWEEYKDSTQYTVLSTQIEKSDPDPSSLLPSPRLRGTNVGEGLPPVALAKGGGDLDLDPFERFYREAEIRDGKMAENLLKAVLSSQYSVFSNNEINKSLKTETCELRTAVLVTGGFHSKGIARKLTEAGVTVVTFVPKITKVDTDSGSAYLGVFSQEKTPLDKLFEGAKLFLAETPIHQLPSRLAFLLHDVQRYPDESSAAAHHLLPRATITQIKRKPSKVSLRIKSGLTSWWVEGRFRENGNLKSMAAKRPFIETVKYVLIPIVLPLAALSLSSIDPSQLVFIRIGLLLLTSGWFGYSHKRIYRRGKGRTIKFIRAAEFTDQLGFAALGIVFRMGFVFSESLWIGSLAAYLAHEIYERKLTHWIRRLPLAMADQKNADDSSGEKGNGDKPRKPLGRGFFLCRAVAHEALLRTCPAFIEVLRLSKSNFRWGHFEPIPGLREKDQDLVIVPAKTAGLDPKQFSLEMERTGPENKAKQWTVEDLTNALVLIPINYREAFDHMRKIWPTRLTTVVQISGNCLFASPGYLFISPSDPTKHWENLNDVYSYLTETLEGRKIYWEADSYTSFQHINRVRGLIQEWMTNPNYFDPNLKEFKREALHLDHSHRRDFLTPFYRELIGQAEQAKKEGLVEVYDAATTILDWLTILETGLNPMKWRLMNMLSLLEGKEYSLLYEELINICRGTILIYLSSKGEPISRSEAQQQPANGVYARFRFQELETFLTVAKGAKFSEKLRKHYDALAAPANKDTPDAVLLRRCLELFGQFREEVDNRAKLTKALPGLNSRVTEEMIGLPEEFARTIAQLFQSDKRIIEIARHSIGNMTAWRQHLTNNLGLNGNNVSAFVTKDWSPLYPDHERADVVAVNLPYTGQEDLLKLKDGTIGKQLRAQLNSGGTLVVLIETDAYDGSDKSANGLAEEAWRAALEKEVGPSNVVRLSGPPSFYGIEHIRAVDLNRVCLLVARMPGQKEENPFNTPWQRIVSWWRQTVKTLAIFSFISTSVILSFLYFSNAEPLLINVPIPMAMLGMEFPWIQIHIPASLIRFFGILVLLVSVFAPVIVLILGSMQANFAVDSPRLTGKLPKDLKTYREALANQLETRLLFEIEHDKHQNDSNKKWLKAIQKLDSKKLAASLANNLVHGLSRIIEKTGEQTADHFAVWRKMGLMSGVSDDFGNKFIQHISQGVVSESLTQDILQILQNAIQMFPDPAPEHNQYAQDIVGSDYPVTRLCLFKETYERFMNAVKPSSDQEKMELHERLLKAGSLIRSPGMLGNALKIMDMLKGTAIDKEPATVKKAYVTAIYNVASSGKGASLEDVVERLKRENISWDSQWPEELKTQYLTAVYQVAMKGKEKALDRILQRLNEEGIRWDPDWPIELQVQFLITISNAAMKDEAEGVDAVLREFANHGMKWSPEWPVSTKIHFLAAMYLIAVNPGTEALPVILSAVSQARKHGELLVDWSPLIWRLVYLSVAPQDDSLTQTINSYTASAHSKEKIPSWVEAQRKELDKKIFYKKFKKELSESIPLASHSNTPVWDELTELAFFSPIRFVSLIVIWILYSLGVQGPPVHIVIFLAALTLDKILKPKFEQAFGSIHGIESFKANKDLYTQFLNQTLTREEFVEKLGSAYRFLAGRTQRAYFILLFLTLALGTGFFAGYTSSTGLLLPSLLLPAAETISDLGSRAWNFTIHYRRNQRIRREGPTAENPVLASHSVEAGTERARRLLSSFEGITQGETALEVEASLREELWEMREPLRRTVEFRDKAISLCYQRLWEDATQKTFMDVLFGMGRDITSTQLTALLTAVRERRVTSADALTTLAILIEERTLLGNGNALTSVHRRLMADILTHPENDIPGAMKSRFLRILADSSYKPTVTDYLAFTAILENRRWTNPSHLIHLTRIVAGKLEAIGSRRSRKRALETMARAAGRAELPEAARLLLIHTLKIHAQEAGAKILAELANDTRQQNNSWILDNALYSLFNTLSQGMKKELFIQAFINKYMDTDDYKLILPRIAANLQSGMTKSLAEVVREAVTSMPDEDPEGNFSYLFRVGVLNIFGEGSEERPSEPSVSERLDDLTNRSLGFHGSPNPSTRDDHNLLKDAVALAEETLPHMNASHQRQLFLVLESASGASPREALEMVRALNTILSNPLLATDTQQMAFNLLKQVSHEASPVLTSNDVDIMAGHFDLGPSLDEESQIELALSLAQGRLAIAQDTVNNLCQCLINYRISNAVAIDLVVQECSIQLKLSVNEFKKLLDEMRRSVSRIPRHKHFPNNLVIENAGPPPDENVRPRPLFQIVQPQSREEIDRRYWEWVRASNINREHADDALTELNMYRHYETETCFLYDEKFYALLLSPGSSTGRLISFSETASTNDLEDELPSEEYYHEYDLFIFGWPIHSQNAGEILSVLETQGIVQTNSASVASVSGYDRLTTHALTWMRSCPPMERYSETERQNFLSFTWPDDSRIFDTFALLSEGVVQTFYFFIHNRQDLFIYRHRTIPQLQNPFDAELEWRQPTRADSFWEIANLPREPQRLAEILSVASEMIISLTQSPQQALFPSVNDPQVLHTIWAKDFARWRAERHGSRGWLDFPWIYEHLSAVRQLLQLYSNGHHFSLTDTNVAIHGYLQAQFSENLDPFYLEHGVRFSTLRHFVTTYLEEEKLERRSAFEGWLRSIGASLNVQQLTLAAEILIGRFGALTDLERTVLNGTNVSLPTAERALVVDWIYRYLSNIAYLPPLKVGPSPVRRPGSVLLENNSSNPSNPSPQGDNISIRDSFLYSGAAGLAALFLHEGFGLGWTSAWFVIIFYLFSYLALQGGVLALMMGLRKMAIVIPMRKNEIDAFRLTNALSNAGAICVGTLRDKFGLSSQRVKALREEHPMLSTVNLKSIDERLPDRWIILVNERESDPITQAIALPHEIAHLYVFRWVPWLPRPAREFLASVTGALAALPVFLYLILPSLIELRVRRLGASWWRTIYQVAPLKETLVYCFILIGVLTEALTAVFGDELKNPAAVSLALFSALRFAYHKFVYRWVVQGRTLSEPQKDKGTIVANKLRGRIYEAPIPHGGEFRMKLAKFNSIGPDHSVSIISLKKDDETTPIAVKIDRQIFLMHSAGEYIVDRESLSHKFPSISAEDVKLFLDGQDLDIRFELVDGEGRARFALYRPHLQKATFRDRLQLAVAGILFGTLYLLFFLLLKNVAILNGFEALLAAVPPYLFHSFVWQQLVPALNQDGMPAWLQVPFAANHSDPSQAPRPADPPASSRIITTFSPGFIQRNSGEPYLDEVVRPSLLQYAFRRFLERLPKAPRILAIGQGIVELESIFEMHPMADIVFVDVVRSQLEAIEREIDEKFPERIAQTSLIHADATSLPINVFPSNHFDLVRLSGVDEYTWFNLVGWGRIHLYEMFKEIHRMLKPGSGMFLFYLSKHPTVLWAPWIFGKKFVPLWENWRRQLRPSIEWFGYNGVIFRKLDEKEVETASNMAMADWVGDPYHELSLGLKELSDYWERNEKGQELKPLVEAIIRENREYRDRKRAEKKSSNPLALMPLNPDRALYQEALRNGDHLSAAFCAFRGGFHEEASYRAKFQSLIHLGVMLLSSLGVIDGSCWWSVWIYAVLFATVLHHEILTGADPKAKGGWKDLFLKPWKLLPQRILLFLLAAGLGAGGISLFEFLSETFLPPFEFSDLFDASFLFSVPGLFTLSGAYLIHLLTHVSLGFGHGAVNVFMHVFALYFPRPFGWLPKGMMAGHDFIRSDNEPRKPKPESPQDLYKRRLWKRLASYEPKEEAIKPLLEALATQAKLLEDGIIPAAEESSNPAGQIGLPVPISVNLRHFLGNPALLPEQIREKQETVLLVDEAVLSILNGDLLERLILLRLGASNPLVIRAKSRDIQKDLHHLLPKDNRLRNLVDLKVDRRPFGNGKTKEVSVIDMEGFIAFLADHRKMPGRPPEDVLANVGLITHPGAQFELGTARPKKLLNLIEKLIFRDLFYAVGLNKKLISALKVKQKA